MLPPATKGPDLKDTMLSDRSQRPRDRHRMTSLTRGPQRSQIYTDKE